AIVMVAIVWYGGSMILDGVIGGFSGKEFIGFIIVFSQLLVPVQNMAKNSANLSKARASQDRIDSVLDEEETIRDPETPTSIKPLQEKISFQNITFAY